MMERNDDMSDNTIQKNEFYKGFIQWCIDEGVRWNGIEFPVLYDDSIGLRGVRCTRDILPYEVIVSVPQKNLLMHKRIEKDEDMKYIFDKYGSIFDHTSNDSAWYSKVIAYMMI
jgi:hypothetical protein